MKDVRVLDLFDLPRGVAVGPGLYEEDYLQIWRCVPLISKLLREVQTLGPSKPDKHHQMNGCSYSNWPS